MTAGSLLPVAPSPVGIPADQRETIHDISQEAPPLTAPLPAEPRSRPFHADLRSNLLHAYAAMMIVCHRLTHAEPADLHVVGHAGSAVHEPH